MVKLLSGSQAINLRRKTNLKTKNLTAEIENDIQGTLNKDVNKTYLTLFGYSLTKLYPNRPFSRTSIFTFVITHDYKLVNQDDANGDIILKRCKASARFQMVIGHLWRRSTYLF